MNIDFKKITVRDLFEGYVDRGDEGVVGYGGALDIRPPYQREFIYKDKQRDAVIDTILKGFPLNVMYWAVCSDGDFEVIDGQQRTISICRYVQGDFSFEGLYFQNRQDDAQKRILDYELMIYQCSGSDSEKLEWFKTINIAGEKLTDQELRNAVYHGPWVSEAKRYFSKMGCAAQDIGSAYMSGSAIRQDYLETAIRWASEDNIEDYMGRHQSETNANALWLYFQGVIEWVKMTFTRKRKEMKSVDWGTLYGEFKDAKLDPKALEEKIVELMMDDDVTSKKGVYPYVLTHEERHLNIRAFTEAQKRAAYERQKGICSACGERFEIEEMEADHITPWHEGGKTDDGNCQMLCKDDNRRKSGK
ncbi:MAG: DUF262 domain-containing protein [Ectothiorhodospiraceae bacterium AqS1]|nr:DUF262 domain-containing protein [Ectothiorhodospiraceae bacterium AqS1]